MNIESRRSFPFPCGTFMRRPALPLLLPALLVLLLSGCASAQVPPSVPTPAVPGVVSTHGLLQTRGNKIVGQHGRPVSLAGNSFFWSQWMGQYYTHEAVAWLKKDWNASIVRAALGVHESSGYLQDPDANFARIAQVVDAAIAQDMYVIVDWHDHHAHRHTAQAIKFFEEIARRYGNRPHLIYEIFNEPLADATWSGDVKPYAEKVIAAIRAIDPDNLIVVGPPRWAQDVDIAAADPLRDANVAYALHFYAGTHKAPLREKAERALRLGAALFVTEWGTCDASGGGAIDHASVREWMAFIRRHDLSHCNWAISDKQETASALVPGASPHGGWKDSELTPSGLFVRELVRGWPPGSK